MGILVRIPGPRNLPSQAGCDLVVGTRILLHDRSGANVYLGAYARTDGTLVTGPSLSDLVAAENADLDAEMQLNLSTTMRKLGQIKTAAEAGMSYDQMMARGNKGGEALVMGGVNALIAQTKTIERVVATLGVDDVAIEGSDSLDSPGAVFE